MIENGSWIVVHRSSSLGWQDVFRAYKVEVDGVVRGKVRRGESLTCEVFAGTHVVQATIDWGGSPEVTVEPASGETIELDVAGVGGRRNASRAAFGADAKHTYLQLTVRGGPAAH